MAELITKILLAVMRKRGEKALAEIKEASMTATTYSEELLMKLISESKDSEYGRKYNFGEIKSIEDYKKMVPITTYDDYAPYIERMVKNGEENLLTSRKVVHFAQSSGSVGVPKKIPVVQEVIDLYSEVGASRSFAIAGKYLEKRGKKFPYHKCLNLVEIIERHTELGVTKGAISSVALRHVRPFLKYFMTTPLEVVYPKEEMDKKYLKLLFALSYENLSFIAGAFTTALVDLMVYLTNNWEMLVEDIRTGTINPEIALSQELRATLEKKLKANPKRADKLRAEFEKGFDTPIIPRIWPKVAWIGGIGTGSFAPYTENLKKYTGQDMPHDNLLYASSESIFACCLELNRPAFLMIPQSGFYEFVPAEDDEITKTYNINELEMGKDYEIILTNLSGFYRYRIYDVVRVLGYYGESPLVQFVYRKNQVVNLAGEKTNTEALAAAIKNFSKEVGTAVVDYSILPDTTTDLARYIFVIETEKELPTSKEDEYARIMEEKLGDANPAFKYAVLSGELDHSKLVLLQSQTYVLWRELQIMKGTSPNQVKPVRVIDTPMKEKFFMKLRQV